MSSREISLFRILIRERSFALANVAGSSVAGRAKPREAAARRRCVAEISRSALSRGVLFRSLSTAFPLMAAPGKDRFVFSLFRRPSCRLKLTFPVPETFRAGTFFALSGEANIPSGHSTERLVFWGAMLIDKLLAMRKVRAASVLMEAFQSGAFRDMAQVPAKSVSAGSLPLSAPAVFRPLARIFRASSEQARRVPLRLERKPSERLTSTFPPRLSSLARGVSPLKERSVSSRAVPPAAEKPASARTGACAAMPCASATIRHLSARCTRALPLPP